MAMARKKHRLSKRWIVALATVLLALAVCLVLVIVNTYLPLRYFTAYAVRRDANEDGVLRVTYIDVGFGDSILIELPDGKTALIDGGNGEYSNNNEILRVLNSHGVDKLDYLICTSVKNEHCGGIAEIIKYKKVEKAFLPYCKNKRITDGFRTAVNAAEECGATVEYSAVGKGIDGGGAGYFLTFLSPVDYSSPGSDYIGLNTDPNSENIDNASAVIWLSYLGKGFLFTSDARTEKYKKIVEEYECCRLLEQPYCKLGDFEVKLEECVAVTAPCHAGKSNTCAKLYEALRPESAVVSVGKSFADYPSAEAVADICNFCKPYYTMYDGNITATVSAADGFKIAANGK